MSATPETDALYAQMLAENPGNFIHLEEFLELARKLEQERDEALTAIHNYKCEVEAWELLRGARRERDEAIKQIDNIRKMLSESGEAVGNGVYNYSIIEMIQNLIRSKSYFIRKSYAEFFKPKTNEDHQNE